MKQASISAMAARLQKALPSPESAAARDTSNRELPSHDQIAVAAYRLWEERGRPEGSPDDDWFSAEKQMLASRRRQAKAGA